MTTIFIAPVSPADEADWLAMRCRLWPGGDAGHREDIRRFFAGEISEPEFVCLARDDRGRPVGFAEFSVRAYAEKCARDGVAYLEGLYVEPRERRAGVARALVEAGEAWGRRRGCIEMASDCEFANDLSALVHDRMGFAEVGTIRCFLKSL